MKKMRILRIVAILMIAICFAACGSKPGSDNGGGSQSGAGEHIHAPMKVAEKVATCTEDGNIEYYACDCGKWFSDGEGKTEIEDKSSVEVYAKGHRLNGSKCGECGKAASDKLEFGLNDDGVSYSVSDIGTETDADIIIPDTHEGLPVAGIGEEAFRDCKFVVHITIPNSVTRIGESAFHVCARLKSIHIPSGVSEIGAGIFIACDGLERITVDPANAKYRGAGNCLIETESKKVIAGCKNSAIPSDGTVTAISEGAFYSCAELKSITVPDSVTDIGEYAFFGCVELKSVTIGNGVKTIGRNAFSWCYNLAELVLGNGLESIGRNAFSSCSSLASVTIPESVEDMDSDAFDGCLLICFERKYEEPSGVFVPDYGAPVVWDCKNNKVADDGNIYAVIGGIRYALKEGKATAVRQPLSLSGDVEIASSVAYDGKTYSVTGIAEMAFSDCYTLSKVTIPACITTVESDAFYKCSGLTIYCEALKKPSGWDESWNVSELPVVWDCRNNKIADDGMIYETVDGIKYGLKDGKATVAGQPVSKFPTNKVRDISFPSSIVCGGKTYAVKSIGRLAFWSLYGFINFTIPEGVTEIEEWAFSESNIIENVTIPSSVTKIGKNAFFCCYYMEQITYKGTKEQWEAVEKGERWNLNAGKFTVHCTDGDIEVKEER